VRYIFLGIFFFCGRLSLWLRWRHNMSVCCFRRTHNFIVTPAGVLGGVDWVEFCAAIGVESCSLWGWGPVFRKLERGRRFNQVGKLIFYPTFNWIFTGFKCACNKSAILSAAKYYRDNGAGTVIMLWAGIAQSVQRLATCCAVRGSNPGGDEIYRTRPYRHWSLPSLL
jgi:hypothetical protein